MAIFNQLLPIRHFGAELTMRSGVLTVQTSALVDEIIVKLSARTFVSWRSPSAC